MNEFSIEHDGRFSLSLTCSERYHGHHGQVSNKEPRSLPQNVPPGETSQAAGSKGRPLYSQATIASYTVPTIPSPYLTLLVSHINNLNCIFRRERSDDRKCVCCSQATFWSDSVDSVSTRPKFEVGPNRRS